jgi:hypothetical protein
LPPWFRLSSSCCGASRFSTAPEPAGVSRNKTSISMRLSKIPSAAAEACGPASALTHQDSTKVDCRALPRVAHPFAKPLQKRVSSRRPRARPLKVVDGESRRRSKRDGITNRVSAFGYVVLRIQMPGRCKAFWLGHAFQLLSCHRGARHSGRGGGLCALSARQSDFVDGPVA